MSITPIAPLIYQFTIVLRDVTPMIWRRILVTSTTTIANLHAIIHIAMGWDDLHLHQFRIYGKAYGVYRNGGITFADDPHHVILADFRLRAGERFLYEYDMGAVWQHDIWLERVLMPTPRQHYPVCRAGGGDCPPEACGGPLGYRALLRERTSWDAVETLRADMGLIVERILAFTNGGSRPTTDDLDVMDALERLQEREEWLPTVFDRRAVNRALRTMGKEYPCTCSFNS